MNDIVDENRSTDDDETWTFLDLVRAAAEGIITEEEFLQAVGLVRAIEKKQARRAAQAKWQREYRRKITKS